MKTEVKSLQLQVRVSQKEKVAIKKVAKDRGLDVSAYVLSRLFVSPSIRYQELLNSLRGEGDKSFEFASLNDFLTDLSPDQFSSVTSIEPPRDLSQETVNYLAAMLDYTATLKSTVTPLWTKEIPPLKNPMFGSELKSLRLHLLLSSPVAFKKRNIFIDSSIGDRT